MSTTYIFPNNIEFSRALTEYYKKTGVLSNIKNMVLVNGKIEYRILENNIPTFVSIETKIDSDISSDGIVTRIVSSSSQENRNIV
jgi:hypothetical protein